MVQPLGKSASPRIEYGKPLLIGGLRGYFTNETMSHIANQWRRFGSYLPDLPKVSESAYGLCYEENGGIQYLCGVEVSPAARLPSELVTVHIPEQQYLVFPHPGHVSTIGSTVQTIWSSGLTDAGFRGSHTIDAPKFFERYGPNFEPATGAGDIEIWVPARAL